MMNQEILFQKLEEIVTVGVGGNHHKGFEWLKDTFIPLIQDGEKYLPEEIYLLSDCYYLLGDIYDFNDTPRAAIEAYLKALTFDPEFAGAYREMAGIYLKLGDVTKAMALIQKACDLDPEDEDNKIDFERISFYIENPLDPYFKPGDPVVIFNDLIASNQYDDAFKQLENIPEEIHYLLALARYHGACFDEAGYFQTWLKIRELKAPFSLSYIDWFYMPETIHKDVKIWEIFLDLYEQIQPGIFISFESLFGSQRFKSLPRGEQHRLEIEFQIYSITENIGKLKELLAIYPEWEELKMEIKKLEQQR